MCIRDRRNADRDPTNGSDTRAGITSYDDLYADVLLWLKNCLLYTSDAADERSSVDLGGRRIIKKKNPPKIHHHHLTHNTQQMITTA